MCGNGERGQLGVGIITMKEYKPLKVQVLDDKGKTYNLTPKFKQISCGTFHTGFLTESGVIYVTGDNSQGQLGLALTSDMTNALVPLDFNSVAPYQIRKLAFGDFSSALTFNGELYVWGVNDIREPALLRPEVLHSKP